MDIFGSFQLAPFLSECEIDRLNPLDPDLMALNVIHGFKRETPVLLIKCTKNVQKKKRL